MGTDSAQSASISRRHTLRGIGGHGGPAEPVTAWPGHRNNTNGGEESGRDRLLDVRPVLSSTHSGDGADTVTYSLLAGVRVVESSAFIAAPLCGLTLAQHGADVIRFDLIGGGIDYSRMPIAPDGRSIYWTSLNKHKRSIAIDIRKAEGRELLAALVTAPSPHGGILLTNVPSPFLAHSTLKRSRPDLISCTIEGNADGSTAVDYTVNCATGYPMITGDATRDKPNNHTLPAWDIACAYQAAFALLAALMRRHTTGEGAEIRLALSDVAFGVLSHLGLLTEAELQLPPRESTGNYIYGAFGRDFVTADGKRIMVAAISTRQWRSLVDATSLGPAIASLEATLDVDYDREADRYEGREIIGGLVARWVSSHPLTTVASRFDAARVCWGFYQSIDELVDGDPRVAPGYSIFSEINTPGVGRHRAAGATMRLAGASREKIRPAPLIGANTDEVLAEILCLPEAAIGGLHDRGIVAGAEADPSVRARAQAASGNPRRKRATQADADGS